MINLRTIEVLYFRCIRSALFSCSQPGGGKRQATLELIGRHPKPFDTITVMHLDPKGTTEYEILGDAAKMIGEDDLPDASTFDRSKRNLLIIDEINITDKRAAYKKKFDRLFNYCSTHCSLSIICQVQDAFTLPVSCRRAMNHWALWRSSDSFVTNTLGRRLGIKNLGDIFDELDLGAHDYVWVDLIWEWAEVTQESDACDYDKRINYLLSKTNALSCTGTFTLLAIPLILPF